MFPSGSAQAPSGPQGYLHQDLYDPMHTPGYNFSLMQPNFGMQSPSTPAVGLGRPLNTYEMSMDDQDRRKLERKRARNRAAASKCRQKKMDRIQDLETQVQTEKVRSQVLDSELMRLRTALTQLEHVMQRHRNQGCSNHTQQQQQQQC